MPTELQHSHPPLSVGTAWGRTLRMTALLWLVLGVGCFGFAASTIQARMGTTVHAAFVLGMVFVVGFLLVTIVTLWWLPRTAAVWLIWAGDGPRARRP